MVFHNKSEEKIIYNISKQGNVDFSHQLLRAFNHIYMEKAGYKFLIIITPSLSLSQRF